MLAQDVLFSIISHHGICRWCKTSTLCTPWKSLQQKRWNQIWQGEERRQPEL